MSSVANKAQYAANQLREYKDKATKIVEIEVQEGSSSQFKDDAKSKGKVDNAGSHGVQIVIKFPNQKGGSTYVAGSSK
jgi:hypothetical protein